MKNYKQYISVILMVVFIIIVSIILYNKLYKVYLIDKATTDLNNGYTLNLNNEVQSKEFSLFMSENEVSKYKIDIDEKTKTVILKNK